MISKELLSVVLSTEVSFIDCEDPRILVYGVANNDDWISINIYELAHKVKEWARTVKQEPMGTYFDVYGTGSTARKHCANLIHQNKVCASNTEPEAIFAAGEYIIKELT